MYRILGLKNTEDMRVKRRMHSKDPRWTLHSKSLPLLTIFSLGLKINVLCKSLSIAYNDRFLR